MSTRIAVVTGGGSGIGRATCTRLTADGFTLAVLDVDGEAAKVAAGPDGLGCAADVADRHAVDAAVRAGRRGVRAHRRAGQQRRA